MMSLQVRIYIKKKLYDDRLRVKKKANKCLWHHSKILFQTLRPFSDWFGGGFRFFYEVYIKNMYFSLWRCCLCFKRVVPFKKSYNTFKPNMLKPRTWCLNRTFPDYLSNSLGQARIERHICNLRVNASLFEKPSFFKFWYFFIKNYFYYLCSYIALMYWYQK